MKMLEYTSKNGNTESIVADKIVRISKYSSYPYECTAIHLVTGEKVLTDDSIKTLQARLEAIE